MLIMPSNQTGMIVGWLAGTYPGRLGHFYSPGGQRGPWPFLPYALDNGAYAAWKKKTPWDDKPWRDLLRWAQWSMQQPLWAVVPDVVADRKETIERWKEYAPIVRQAGFRPAFAAQDGMTFADVPDSDCVVFLGGSTDPTPEWPQGWKQSAIGPWCQAFPGRVHVGRVNSWPRLVACWRAGAIAVDGTGWFHEARGHKRPSSQRSDLIKFLRETQDRSAAA